METQADGQISGAAPSPPQPPQSLLGQPLATVPEEGAECLKCNTFAELQERLDCIDGSEEVRVAVDAGGFSAEGVNCELMCWIGNEAF